jgi:hypothetical protein
MEVNKEIEEMLNALGDPTPKDAKVEDEEEEEETAEEKTAREAKEAEEAANLSEEEKAAKEEEDAEATRLAEEEKLKNETSEEKTAREAKEASDEVERKAAEETKEKEALAKIKTERETREKEEEETRKKAEENARKKDEPLKLDEQDFIGDLDLDDLTRDKTALNKILNAVYSKGVNDSKKMATEGVLTTIPDIVKHNINLMTTLAEARDKFYKENEDLVPFKAVVAAVFEEVASKNSDKKIGEIMNLVAPEVRTRLQLKKEAVKKEEKKEEKKETPRLHGAKGGNQRGNQREKPDTKGLSDEIASMNKALGF